MIDNSIVLDNPLIPDGYYYAKLLTVETEPSDYVYPKILATLGLHQMYNLAPNNVLCAIIHPTANSHFHYKNFHNTFFMGKRIDELRSGINRWGSVKSYRTQFNGVEYSAVRFIYQPLPIMMDCWQLSKDESRE